MKKSVVFIFFLLAIILAEALALLWRLKNPVSFDYELASVEYVLAEKDISAIKPFLFESHWADEVSAELDEIVRVINDNSANVKKLPQQIKVKSNNEAESEKEAEDLSFGEEQADIVAPISTEDGNKALIAVIIDDVGLSVPFTNQLAKIEKPITVAFLPYGASDKAQVNKLKNAGFEVMLHTPMLPHVKADLAPVTLSPQMDKAEIQAKFKKMLERFAQTGMVGANNHMGSMFTEDKAAMSAVVEILRQENMFFLDSKTTSKSVCKEVCKEYGVPYIARDVFLDNVKDYKAIMEQFAAAERIAKKRGYAVAIGHPYKQTLQALRDWESQNEEHGVKIVPLSYLVQKNNSNR